MKHCFLKLSLCLSIITTLISACGNSELMSKLEDVESYLSEAPDSALSVLDSIPEESLSSGKLRAKYALLRSMALDKNYIDVTSDSIIRPAVEYYSRRGSADERLKTGYYRGMVSYYAGDIDSAMKYFVEAESSEKRATDNSMKGKLHRMKQVVYAKLFLINEALKEEKLASRYFLLSGEKIPAFNSDINIANLFMRLGQKDSAKVYLKKCGEVADSLPGEQRWLYYSNTLEYDYDVSASPDVVLKHLSSYMEKCGPDTIDSLSIADALGFAGKNSEALTILDEYQKSNDVSKNQVYYTIRTRILQMLSDYEGAYMSYAEYVRISDNDDLKIFQSEAKFAEEKFANQMEKQRFRFNIIIFAVFLMLVVVVLVVSVCLFIKRISRDKVENERLSMEKEELESMMAEAESEKVSLKVMMNEYMGEELRSSIKSRLSRLDRCLAQQMSGSLDSVHDELKSVLKDKRLFLEDTVSTIMFQHPAFLTYLKKHKLTKPEIAKCCLVLMGVDGKSMASFLEVKETTQRNAMYEIRKKLGLNNESRELKTFLNDKVKELDGEF